MINLKSLTNSTNKKKINMLPESLKLVIDILIFKNLQRYQSQ